jgi:hypothetical protein
MLPLWPASTSPLRPAIRPRRAPSGCSAQLRVRTGRPGTRPWRPDLEHDRGLDVQPQEPPLDLRRRILALVSPRSVGDVPDVRLIGEDVRVAVWALDARPTELGVIPTDVRTAEQPQMPRSGPGRRRSSSGGRRTRQQKQRRTATQSYRRPRAITPASDKTPASGERHPAHP